ncbi:chaperonin GroEL [Candidatus Liberibacter sp.]|uniref:chaperonin GroEL n=1 Tax=Candidatus Liberibacter sp. TaxID=34022 RepID=UPI0015F5422C|nr:chaperonin GroEL [Candidatus Liberibacter sp.]MBA5724184.1 chaperonin GroEL [Candidatus Liberibacter sp.]
MTAKDVRLGSSAREGVVQGVNILANAVKVTLGPKGRFVVISNPYGNCRVTKDGVTVAKSINLQDPLHDIGARMMREVTSNANDHSGDGTTTAACLAQSLIKEGIKAVAAGRNPMDLKRGMDAAVKEVVKYLQDNHKKVESREEIIQVATISANGDREIGEKIAYAMEKVGRQGVITIDESKTADTEVKVVEGMQFDRGYLSPYFVTNSEKMAVEFDNPYILVHEKKISSLPTLVPLLEQVVQSNRPLLIIAEDVEGEALATLVVNRLRGGLQVAACKPPAFGERRLQILQDIAALTGATLISDDIGVKLDKATIDDLGSAKKVLMTKDDTTIVGGNGSKDNVLARVREIETAISSTTSDYDREKLQERLAKLSGGVAIISVGDATETALKEKKDRVEDALGATRSAVETGIVPGGGVALVRASKSLKIKGENDDQSVGVDIVRRALMAPCRQIIENAGDEAALIAGKIQENESKTYGYDAQNGVFCDMFEAGIVDPVKVVRNAIQDSVGVASMMLITEVTVTELPKEATPSPQMPAGGGMPGMGGMGGMDMM